MDKKRPAGRIKCGCTGLFILFFLGGGRSFNIFCCKSGFQAISIHLRSFITPDPRSPVDDPGADVVGIVADLQNFQAATAVEDPFADVADRGRKHNLSEIDTFEKGTLVQYFQRIRQLQLVHGTEIKGLFADIPESSENGPLPETYSGKRPGRRWRSHEAAAECMAGSRTRRKPRFR